MKWKIRAFGSLFGMALVLGGLTTAPASAGSLWPDVGVGAWGQGTTGQLGNGGLVASNIPVATTVPAAMSGRVVTDVSANNNFACAVASGAAFCWGQRSNGKLGDGGATTGQSTDPVAVSTSGALSGKMLTKVAAGGGNSACALDSAGAAYCWGLGTSGQLGNGGTSSSSVPVPVTMPTGKTFTSISVGNAHACASTADLLAYCWGANGSGQLGNGTTSVSATSTPVQVNTLAGVTSVSAGYLYSCAVNSGAGFCWGQQEGGKLGNNSSAAASVSSPVAVDTSGALTGKVMTQISAGAQSGGGTPGIQGSTCAVADGQAYCWGYGGTGRLGNGASSNQTTAVKVSDAGVLNGKTIRTLSNGWNNACVTTTDFGVYCWGSSSAGQLGNGGAAASDVPIAVSTPDAFRVNFVAAGAARPVLAVSAGNSFVAAAYGYAGSAGSPVLTYSEPTLQWVAPTYLGTSATASYLLTYRPSSTPTAPFRTFMKVTAATTSINVETYAAAGCPAGAVCPRAYGALVAGTSYDFQVSAMNGSGNGRNSSVTVVSWTP